MREGIPEHFTEDDLEWACWRASVMAGDELISSAELDRLFYVAIDELIEHQKTENELRDNGVQYLYPKPSVECLEKVRAVIGIIQKLDEEDRLDS